MSSFSLGPQFGECASPESGRVYSRPGGTERTVRSTLQQDFEAVQQQAEDRLAALARTIEYEIIPRLLISHVAPAETKTVAPSDDLTTSAADLDELTRIVLEGSAARACAAVAIHRQRGVSLEMLFLELLGPAARRLGELWEQDRCTFTDVTIGLSCLQQVLREFSPAFELELDTRDNGRRILLVPAESERHTFGLFMVEEFFRRSGWDVWGGTTLDAGAQVRLVRNEHIHVVGFSISSEKCIDALISDIRNVRQASLNRDVCVMVGGSLINQQPDLVGRVGADETAADGRDAVEKANELIERFGSGGKAGRRKR